jgi:hypothetical protein
VGDSWREFCPARLSGLRTSKQPEAASSGRRECGQCGKSRSYRNRYADASRGKARWAAREKTLERPYSNGYFFTLPSARVFGGMRTMLHAPITLRQIQFESNFQAPNRPANLILALFPLRNRISHKTNTKLGSNPHTQGIFKRIRLGLSEA